MDGYSIQEAAEVLGVPKRRIRELVERGVILGSDEGDDGLRVYLQPRPPSSFERAAASQSGPEASPFRELLNEFRNLTERYGQALLALGESRGEVAALRGRVEALETRIDLRLGTSAGPSVVEWHAPPPAFEAETLADLAPREAQTDGLPAVEATPEPVAVAEEPQTDTGEAAPPVEEPTTAAEPEVETAAEAEIAQPAVESETRQRPRRGISAIVAGGIAEALARAVDPSTGEFPPPAEVAADAPTDTTTEAEPEPVMSEAGVASEADFAAQAEVEAEAEPDFAGAAEAESEFLPAEPETDDAIEDELVALGPEVDQSVYSAEIEEPDWLAEGEYTWLDAAQVEQRDEQIEELPHEPATEEATGAGGEDQPSIASGDFAADTADGEPEAVTEAPSVDEPEAAPPLAAAGDEDSQPSAEAEEQLIAETAPERGRELEEEQPFAASSEMDVLEDVESDQTTPTTAAAEGEPIAEERAEEAEPVVGDGLEPIEEDLSEEPAAEVEGEPGAGEAVGDEAFGDEAAGDQATGAETATLQAEDDEAFDGNPDAAAPVSGELPDEALERIPQPGITEVLVAEEHIFEALPAVDVVDVADELELEEPPVAAERPAAPQPLAAPERPAAPQPSAARQPSIPPPAPAAPTPMEQPAIEPPRTEPRALTPETNSGEVPLMWLGGDPEDREEYAAEIEVGTAGWQTSTPPLPAGPDPDELTRIAHDQGWDANEVEAIRSLLEPASLGEAGVETAESEPVEPEPEPDDVPVIGAIDSPDGPEPEIENDVGPETPPTSAGWPAEDPTISFPLPGGDELRKALDALGLPASERERQEAMAAQRAQWAKSPPPQGDATRALLRPPVGRESSRPEPDAPRGNAEATADEHAPEGEPEWLRGRRDPAARAYRRLRRIFPS